MKSPFTRGHSAIEIEYRVPSSFFQKGQTACLDLDKAKYIPEFKQRSYGSMDLLSLLEENTYFCPATSVPVYNPETPIGSIATIPLGFVSLFKPRYG